MTNAAEIKSHLRKNLIILAFTVGVAALLAGTGFFERILTFSQATILLESFIAGFFYTSVLTVGPATVALGTLAQYNSIFAVALLGGAGAVCGDFILFKFVRDRITDDFLALFQRNTGFKRIAHLFHLEIFRFLTPFLGALIVASPLPDELGLAMMGIAKIKASLFIPFSFAANAIGIAIIALISKGLL